MSVLSIAYDLGRHGWSSFLLTFDGKEVLVGPFGYCTDALGDLLRAALLMATMADRAEVRFDGEPQEWRLTVDEGWEPEALLSVRYEGTLLLEGRIRGDEFARAAQNVAQKLWDEFGAAGYNERWGGSRGFPFRALRALDTALQCDEPTSKS